MDKSYLLLQRDNNKFLVIARHRLTDAKVRQSSFRGKLIGRVVGYQTGQKSFQAKVLDSGNKESMFTAKKLKDEEKKAGRPQSQRTITRVKALKQIGTIMGLVEIEEKGESLEKEGNSKDKEDSQRSKILTEVRRTINEEQESSDDDDEHEGREHWNDHNQKDQDNLEKIYDDKEQQNDDSEDDDDWLYQNSILSTSTQASSHQVNQPKKNKSIKQKGQKKATPKEPQALGAERYSTIFV